MSTEDAFRPFPATQWSLIGRAREGDTADRREALSVLLQRYLPAMRAHLVAGKGIAGERADDLLQGFVADKIIEQDLLSRARQERGKFRSFLLVTLERYVVSAHRTESAAKRRPAGGLVRLGEDAHQIESGDKPADQFSIAWAHELIAEALRRMKAECERIHRPDIWTIFEGRVIRTAMDGREPLEYGQLVSELGLTAPLEACRLLTTAKRMFARNLRAVAGEYTDSETAAEGEIEDLRQILAARGGAQSRARLRN